MSLHGPCLCGGCRECLIAQGRDPDACDGCGERECVCDSFEPPRDVNAECCAEVGP